MGFKVFKRGSLVHEVLQAGLSPGRSKVLEAPMFKRHLFLFIRKPSLFSRLGLVGLRESVL